MEETVFSACAEQDLDDHGILETILPPTISSPATRPILPRAPSSSYPLSPNALCETVASNTLALSPPHTPPQQCHYGLAEPVLLPPIEININSLPIVPVSSTEACSGDAISRPLATKHTITPPEDIEHSGWLGGREGFAASAPAPFESEEVATGSMSSDSAVVDQGGAVASTSANPNDLPQMRLTLDWLSGIVDDMYTYKDDYKIVSHILPCPHIESHAFRRVVSHVLERQASQNGYTTVVQAAPPESKPTTPQAYLNHNIIFLVKTVDDFYRTYPEHFAAPGSVHLAVVERIIPPCLGTEIEEMWSESTEGYIARRLHELSHEGGTLAFMYPTKAGAQSYSKECRESALDPVLRALVTRYDLKIPDFYEAISKLSCTNAVPTFRQMRAKMSGLCSTLNSSDARPHSCGNVKLNLIHAAQVDVHVDPSVWIKLFIEQERRHIQEAVQGYYTRAKEAQMLPKGDHDEVLPQYSLIAEILSGLETRATEQDMCADIEVGIFVIKKTSNDCPGVDGSDDM
ncbi:MAG: hypothetical protein Q9159_003148 [Coniocarpon cinnabarinum]